MGGAAAAVSCQPSTWTERERRLVRALAHAVRRDHPLNPARCHGCREAAGFLTVPGYEGDTEYPTCVLVIEDGPDKGVRVRDHAAGLKFQGGSGLARPAQGGVE